jgi:hypothetical protein
MTPWGQRRSDWSPWTRFTGVVVFAAAMAHVEGVVVYYLRKLLVVQPWQLVTAKHLEFPHQYLRVEQRREMATIVMLLAVGYLAGRTTWQKLAYFLLAFGVWDIGYYISLRLMIGWPTSPLSRDLLFLTPSPCWGRVWQPVAVSVAFIVASVFLIKKTRRA